MSYLLYHAVLTHLILNVRGVSLIFKFFLLSFSLIFAVLSLVVEGKRSPGLTGVWVARNKFAVLDKSHQVTNIKYSPLTPSCVCVFSWSLRISVTRCRKRWPHPLASLSFLLELVKFYLKTLRQSHCLMCSSRCMWPLPPLSLSLSLTHTHTQTHTCTYSLTHSLTLEFSPFL